MKLEVGMYVRTTYGVGKIIKSYIVYSDDGSLWHLAYMTDNPKVEVAIYTKKSSWELFGEVQENHRIKYEPIENNLDLVDDVYEQELLVVCYVPVDNNYPRNAELFDEHKFIKASHNIIDLIEVGDYVNGVLVESIYSREEDKMYFHTFETEIMIEVTKENINNIVTKEQFESISYEV